MSLFNPRKDTEKWAAIVMPMSKGPIPEKTLDAATSLFIDQRCRILYESIQLFLTSKYKDTRQSRYKLACEHYGALIKVKKYANREQRKKLDQAIDTFVKADDMYRHPNRAKAIAEKQARQKKKDEFWEAYGMLEMLEVFSDDWD